MKKIDYVQCDLMHIVDSYVIRQTAWIPCTYANKDNCLRIKENGVWSEWVVTAVYWQNVVNFKAIPDSHIQIRQHRRNTGDALKK